MLERLVAFCLRWPWAVVAFTLALTAAGVQLTVDRFAIDTDTRNLFAPDIPWRKNETQLYKSFPQVDDIIVAVVDGDTPQKADDGARRLTEALQGKPLMQRVWRPDDHEFFRRNGLLFLDKPTLQRTVGTLIAQKDILQSLA